MSTADPALPNRLRDETDPTFDAPWQTQAFALVVRLSVTGHFGWNEWVRVFSREVARSPSRAGEGENDTYYRQWLDALERITVERGLLAPGDAQERASAWRAAYVNTPHGQPVELAHATCPPARTHGKIPWGARNGQFRVTSGHLGAATLRIIVKWARGMPQQSIEHRSHLRGDQGAVR